MNEAGIRGFLSQLNIEVEKKESGDWLMCRCPYAPHYHERGTDSKPSFGVHIDVKGISGFYCFTCNQRGNLHKLAKDIGRLNGVDTNELANKILVAEIPDQIDNYDAIYAQALEDIEEAEPINKELYLSMYPLASECEESMSYLASRDISPITSDILQLRYDPERRRVMFPIIDCNGDLYGFSGRSVLGSDELGTMPKVRDYHGLQKSKLLLGEHLIAGREGKPILVVEGLFALAKVVELGALDFCVPVATMKASMSDTQADIIKTISDTCYVLYDNDKAGRRGAYGEGESRLDPDGGVVKKLSEDITCFGLPYPKGIDDPDDLKEGHLEKMISYAKEHYLSI